MVTGTVQVRQGKSTDLSQIREFTQHTFRWGDYLPDAWNHWVVSTRGDLLVAEIDDQIVGTVHVRYLENQEAWLEGVRVRPEFRKCGVASQLIQTAHSLASSKKCRVMRLETGANNLAARRTFEKFGYRREVLYAVHKAETAAGTLDGVRAAKLSDLRACWELWMHSWGNRASKSIVPAPYGWRWWELTRKRLGDDIRAGRVWMTPGALMTVRREDDSWDITLAVGGKRAAVNLLQTARVLAYQDNKPQVFWLAPYVARTRDWAISAGYVLDEDDLLIYACPL